MSASVILLFLKLTATSGKLAMEGQFSTNVVFIIYMLLLSRPKMPHNGQVYTTPIHRDRLFRHFGGMCEHTMLCRVMLFINIFIYIYFLMQNSINIDGVAFFLKYNHM